MAASSRMACASARSEEVEDDDDTPPAAAAVLSDAPAAFPLPCLLAALACSSCWLCTAAATRALATV